MRRRPGDETVLPETRAFAASDRIASGSADGAGGPGVRNRDFKGLN